MPISGREAPFFRFSAGCSKRLAAFYSGHAIQRIEHQKAERLRHRMLQRGRNMRQPSKNEFGSATGRSRDRYTRGLRTARRVVRSSEQSRLAGMRTTASLRMVPETYWRFFKRRGNIHSKAGQLLVNSVADKLRFVGDSAGVQTFLQGPLKLRIHWESDQLLIWRPFIWHRFIKSIRILL